MDDTTRDWFDHWANRMRPRLGLPEKEFEELMHETWLNHEVKGTNADKGEHVDDWSPEGVLSFRFSIWLQLQYMKASVRLARAKPRAVALEIRSLAYHLMSMCYWQLLLLEELTELPPTQTVELTPEQVKQFVPIKATKIKLGDRLAALLRDSQSSGEKQD